MAHRLCPSILKYIFTYKCVSGKITQGRYRLVGYDCTVFICWSMSQTTGLLLARVMARLERKCYIRIPRSNPYITYVLLPCQDRIRNTAFRPLGAPRCTPEDAKRRKILLYSLSLFLLARVPPSLLHLDIFDVSDAWEDPAFTSKIFGSTLKLLARRSKPLAPQQALDCTPHLLNRIKVETPTPAASQTRYKFLGPRRRFGN